MKNNNSCKDYNQIEQAFYRAKRTLSTIVKCHELTMQVQSEEEMLDGICHILVDSINYKLAWIQQRTNRFSN